MPTLTIHLREGFFGTPVVVFINGRQRFRSESVTTRMQIGLAETVAFDVPTGNVDVAIQLSAPNRSIRQILDVRGETHLGIDLDENGLATIRVQEEPYRYM
jgi:hypothetical protein